MKRPSSSRSRSVVALLVLGLLGLVPTWAGQSRIELSDGSVLTGELVGVEAGGYHIRSAALGELVVPESRVLAIRPLGSAGAAATPTPTREGAASGPLAADPGASAAALLDLQQQMTSDADIMSAIESLRDDPELRAALSDPSFARAVLSGDIEGLQRDQRFLNLVDHPTVRRIIDQVTGR